MSEAVWHDDRCTWFGDDVEDDGGPGLACLNDSAPVSAASA